MKKQDKVLAWHFLRPDKRLGYKDGRKVVKGRKMKCGPDRTIRLCEYGMHASLSPLDALSFVHWANPIICRVELSGGVLHGEDKIVAPERKVIAWCDADKLLHEFACRVAECALVHFEKRYPNDKRPRLAIEAKRLWLQGKITDAELRAARGAAADADASAAYADADADAAAARKAAKNKYNQWLTEMFNEALGLKGDVT